MVSSDQARVLFAMALSYPLAYPYRTSFLRSPSAKHAYSIVTTTSLWVALFGAEGYIQLIISILITYFLVAKWGRNRCGAAIVFAVVFGHLCINRIMKQWRNYTDMQYDFTAPQLILVIKLTSFAWSYHDGGLPSERIHEEQRNSAVHTYPNLLEFIGFALFVPGFFSGPAFNLSEYVRFSKNEAYPESPSQGEWSSSAANMGEANILAIKKLAVSVCCFFGFVTINDYLGLNYHYALTDNFVRRFSIIARILYFVIPGFAQRLKFYGIWELAEGACIMSGIGYNGTGSDGKARWDRLSNVNIVKLELASNLKEVFDNWNIMTAKWLRQTVYVRIKNDALRDTTPGGTSRSGGLASLATFLVSAAWHGFYPGYYLTFTSGAFFLQVARVVRKYVRPFFANPQSQFHRYHSIYDAVTTAATSVVLNFLVGAFIYLRWDYSIEVWWSRCFLLCHFAALIVFLSLEYFGLGKYFSNLQRRWEAKASKE
ncbi:MBOAT, membrane-bound O-acyltransferase family-domain-containing protein [Cladochytrium replicatum]|nr:MBOAT, membrane-bound O-acyltransferase family-domain-containing protein [Cladochytrium replicatum]